MHRSAVSAVLSVASIHPSIHPIHLFCIHSSNLPSFHSLYRIDRRGINGFVVVLRDANSNPLGAATLHYAETKQANPRPTERGVKVPGCSFRIHCFSPKDKNLKHVTFFRQTKRTEYFSFFLLLLLPARIIKDTFFEFLQFSDWFRERQECCKNPSPRVGYTCCCVPYLFPISFFLTDVGTRNRGMDDLTLERLSNQDSAGIPNLSVRSAARLATFGTTIRNDDAFKMSDR